MTRVEIVGAAGAASGSGVLRTDRRTVGGSTGQWRGCRGGLARRGAERRDGGGLLVTGLDRLR